MKLHEAMSTVNTKQEADHVLGLYLFKGLIETDEKVDIEQAKKNLLDNIAYIAAYKDHTYRLKIEELFNCCHPILGKASDGELTPKQCFDLGYNYAQRIKNESTNTKSNKK